MTAVSVILPAAGSSRRFGAATSKIFQPLGGREVLLRTVDLFAGRDNVCQIQLVVSEADGQAVAARFGKALAERNVSLTAGGPTRSSSVRNALAAVAAQADLVCVHDAVRPCTPPEQIDAVFAAAAEAGAAILAVPIRATVKRVGPDEVIAETVCRNGLWAAQTPQVFDKDLLIRAYASGAEATDDAELVQSLGHPVRVVAGDARNIKITTPADLAMAERFIPAEGPPSG